MAVINVTFFSVTVDLSPFLTSGRDALLGLLLSVYGVNVDGTGDERDDEKLLQTLQESLRTAAFIILTLRRMDGGWVGGWGIRLCADPGSGGVGTERGGGSQGFVGMSR